jgi:molybdopterin synthase catalytic subunit
MAKRELGRVCDETIDRFEVRQIAVAHRIGRVNPGEVSIAIAVASPHRTAAFDAARWMMDQIKSRVPVWKKDFASDGTASWVTPDMNQVSEAGGGSS